MKTIWVDGGCRNNGTPQAKMYGSYFYHSRTQLDFSGYPHQTNNIAEYLALIEALEFCDATKISQVEFRMDSNLVVNQVLGRWKIENKDLKELRDFAKKLLDKVQGSLIKVDRKEIFSKVGH